MKRHNLSSAGAWLLVIHLFVVRLAAQDWTRFRGPNGSGVSLEKGIPAAWTEQNIKWRSELAGAGHSSPVVWANQVFLTSADAKSPKLHVYGINAGDGSRFWQREFDLVPYALHQFNTFASSTPAVDERHLYLAWLTRGHYTVTALDHSGHTVWERDLGPFESQHGSGTSPMIYGDTVIIVKDPDGESFVLALSAQDGTTRWQTSLQGSRADYSTPCLYQPTGSKPSLVFTSMENGVIGLDPDAGKITWQLEKVFSQRCVSSPVIAAGLIIGSCGSGAGGNYVAAVRPGDPRNGKKPELAYVVRKSAPYVPTSVALGELLFLWSDAGIVTCLHGPSGQVKWQERVGGDFFASPVCVGGRLFGVSSSGEVVVLEASDRFRELARNQLHEATHATPAVSGGRMYVRTVKHLISVGGSE